MKILEGATEFSRESRGRSMAFREIALEATYFSGNCLSQPEKKRSVERLPVERIWRVETE